MIHEPSDVQHQDAALLACLLEVQRLLAVGEERVVERALEVLLSALPATRLALFEIDADGGISQGPTAVRNGCDPLMSATIAERVLTGSCAVLIAPPGAATQGQSCILGVPVHGDGRIRGVLLCDNCERPDQLDATHLRMLDALARSLENVVQRDELRRLAAERQRNEREVAAARQIQEFLTSGTSGSDMCGTWSVIYRPALDLAGDVFAVHGDADSATWLVADVSGKGLPAALVAAMIKVASGRRLREGAGPGELLIGLHQDLLSSMPPTMFFTACALRLSRDGSFSACGVGHPSVLVIRTDGTVERLRSIPGMLGLRLFDLAPSRLNVIAGTLRPGDRLALITDGATEAIDPDEAMLGEEGVSKALAAVAGRPPAEMSAALEAAVGAFRRGLPVGDDLTVVIGGI